MATFRCLERKDDNMGSMIASNRVETLVRMVVDSARKSAEEAAKDLENRKVLTDANFQRVLAQGDKVAASVKAVLFSTLAELAENIVGRLKLISGGQRIAINVTSGKHTLAKATDVFEYIDSDFKNWGLDVTTEPTPETEVAVYETIKDGTHTQIFGGFGENLDRLCLTQDQIRVFCREHRDWLRTDGYATFFLFKVNGKFFVARVRVYDGRLKVYVYQFGGDGVWRAEVRRRIVVPQL